MQTAIISRWFAYLIKNQKAPATWEQYERAKRMYDRACAMYL